MSSHVGHEEISSAKSARFGGPWSAQERFVATETQQEGCFRSTNRHIVGLELRYSVALCFRGASAWGCGFG